MGKAERDPPTLCYYPGDGVLLLLPLLYNDEMREMINEHIIGGPPVETDGPAPQSVPSLC